MGFVIGRTQNIRHLHAQKQVGRNLSKTIDLPTQYGFRKYYGKFSIALSVSSLDYQQVIAPNTA